MKVPGLTLVFTIIETTHLRAGDAREAVGLRPVCERHAPPYPAPWPCPGGLENVFCTLSGRAYKRRLTISSFIVVSTL